MHNFNPRSHERSDTINSLVADIISTFQSTLPREERLCTSLDIASRFDISIHAPTRGATPSNAILISCLLISIHAPTRGATSEPVTPSTRSRFQSTLPREERLLFIFTSLVFRKFQSTLPREERRDPSYVLGLEELFQSTLPREERLIFYLLENFECYFNPRSHERSDSGRCAYMRI